MYTCYIQSFKILASFCSWAGGFECYLVENLRRHVFAWCGSILIFTSLSVHQVGTHPNKVRYWEMSHDMTKLTKWVCTQRRLRSAWTSAQFDQSSLSSRRNFGSLATHWVHSKDSDQTGRMSRVNRVFAERTLILLVLTCRGSYLYIASSQAIKHHLI